MNRINGKIMSTGDFSSNHPDTQEPYQGILVSADTRNDQYKIAVKLSENQVMLVDQVSESEVHDRLREWAPRVDEIQKQNLVDNALGNYSHC